MKLVTDIKELERLLQIELEAFYPAKFKLRVPKSFVDRMEKGNIHDPLLAQILPVKQEQDNNLDYILDPLHEKQFNPVPGLLHKYHGRVLIIPTGACAINCRYCFRREFPYADNALNDKKWDDIFTYINQDPSITEIIISGGDPLVLTDKLLVNFIEKVNSIQPIKTLRFHTRIPIVMPERITPDFIKVFKILNKKINLVIITHCNHPNEINEDVKQGIKKFKKIKNITLLNQSVLLKNINNNPDILIRLSQTLFDAGIMPYYLHCLDKVKGVGHFEVSDQEAKKIYKIMQEKLPGYLVPKLVREIAGEKHKVMIN